jgi:hypothetical protein
MILQDHVEKISIYRLLFYYIDNLVNNMSRIDYREMSLSAVIEDSNLVVEVKFIESYQEEVSIFHKEAVAGSEKFPAFIKKGDVFKVIRVLKNTGKIKVPETIRVPNENWRRFLGQHKEQYLQAPSKSYNVPEYVSTLKTSAKASVLFLNHFQDMYEFTACNSWESKAELEKIEMLIASE